MTTATGNKRETLVIVTYLFEDERTVLEATRHISPAARLIELDVGAMNNEDWDSLVAAMLAADNVITV